MMAEQNMQEFIEVLSSNAAVPGGGGACAYVAGSRYGTWRNGLPI